MICTEQLESRDVDLTILDLTFEVGLSEAEDGTLLGVSQGLEIGRLELVAVGEDTLDVAKDTSYRRGSGRRACL